MEHHRFITGVDSLAYTQTKCFECQNAVPTLKRGCSWSRNFEPVQGWEAIPTTVGMGHKRVPSYVVINCPSYIPDRAE